MGDLSRKGARAAAAAVDVVTARPVRADALKQARKAAWASAEWVASHAVSAARTAGKTAATVAAEVASAAGDSVRRNAAEGAARAHSMAVEAARRMTSRLKDMAESAPHSSGSGAPLALVKKAVSQHSGKVTEMAAGLVQRFSRNTQIIKQVRCKK